MRQRLGIAGALVHRPPVVDPRRAGQRPRSRGPARRARAHRRRCAARSTVLFSTHVLADVERICDRVGILDHGRLVVEGAAGRAPRPVRPARLPRRGRNPARARRLERPRRDACASLPWVTAVGVEHGLLTVAVADPSVAGSRAAAGAIAASGLGVISVARARPTLEDVFLRLTGDATGAAGMSGFRVLLREGARARRGGRDACPSSRVLFVAVGIVSPLTARYLRRDPAGGAGRSAADPAPGSRRPPRRVEQLQKNLGAAGRARGDRARDGMRVRGARPRDGGPRARPARDPARVPARPSSPASAIVLGICDRSPASPSPGPTP